MKKLRKVFLENEKHAYSWQYVWQIDTGSMTDREIEKMVTVAGYYLGDDYAYISINYEGDIYLHSPLFAPV